jgi:hypothetical protein
MDDRASISLTKIYKAIEQTIRTDVLVPDLHVPTAIGTDISARFHLYPAEPRAIEVSDYNIGVGTPRGARAAIYPRRSSSAIT